TAELVGKAIGVSYNSVGSLGSLQTVIIRGATSSKNLVFLDGVLLSSAHDSSVDLSIIPINIIERIEVVKSGPGNLGRTNAIGGMVNIITKKGQDSETPFSLTFENGSFLPLAYSSDQKRNYLSLVDSQKLDFSYTKEGLIVTVGGLAAENAYTYNDGSANLKLRDNAQVYEAYTNLSYTKDLSKALKITTQNVATFKNLGVPGSLSYGLTPNDYMNNTFISTTNTLELAQASPLLEKLTAQIHYGFGQTFYHDATFGDSTHTKHKASALIEGTYDLGQAYTLKTDLNYSLDYVDSTDVGQNTRHNIAGSAYGSIYFNDGSISLHPSVQVAYLSDLKTVSP
ncbi:MAG: TonB-dependent receptor, partial [Spirochaetia bacterium]|nr:TonB-dependent receptor [Spirochaetia bacterium]